MKPEDIAGKPVGGGKASAQLAQLKTFAESLDSADQPDRQRHAHEIGFAA